MRHVLVLAVLVVVLAACGGTSNSLPYDKVTVNTADARRAFAGEHISLVVKSRGAAADTTLGDRRDAFEVDVFGEPDALRREGFRDLPRGRDCAVAGHLALRWHGNVRAILNCDLVDHDRAWVAKMDRALAALD